MNQNRVQKLEDREYIINNGKNILYKMSREHRVDYNWSLIYAQKLAIENKVKLFVIYTHYDKKWECVSRTVDFILSNLKLIQQELFEKNISFEYVQISNGGDKVAAKENNKTKNQTSNFLSKYCTENNIGLIVTDMTPQREQNYWRQDFLDNNKEIAVHVVDARNVIPVWITSVKEEFAARTIRSKIYKKIEEYIGNEANIFSKIKTHTNNDNKYVKDTQDNTDWNKIRKEFDCIESDLSFEETNFLTGHAESKKRLDIFLKDRLENYADNRNIATMRGQSDLSPYINFGMISRQYILVYILDKYNLSILDVLDPAKNGSGDAEQENNTKLSNELIKSMRAFFEETIVRAELADNYVYYQKNYDNFDGLANWGKLSLEKGRNDERDYIYSKEEWEKAATHDTLWNAAQNEMIRTGKMHGYMRMYWAKKILEWTNSPEEAIEVSVYLNDKYNIDGWSPGSYTGILWSVGGLHDRAWFPRKVFSTIRYMALSGCEKKFDVKAYKEKWNTKSKILENKLF